MHKGTIRKFDNFTSARFYGKSIVENVKTQNLPVFDQSSSSFFYHFFHLINRCVMNFFLELSSAHHQAHCVEIAILQKFRENKNKFQLNE